MASIADLLRAGMSGLYGSVGGWPVDTGVSLANLGRAAYGYGGSKLGLLAPQELPDMIDPANVPGSTASISGLLGVGDSGPEQAAQVIGGLLAPGGTKNAASKLDMTVYHGSPHSFDKFDMSHLGSGEGAQAYGHGLYFADNPAVALEYQKALAPGVERSVNGASYDSSNPQHLAAAYMDMFAKQGKSPQEIAGLLRTEGGTPAHVTAADIVESGLAGKMIKKPAGNLYKVDIPDEAVANMLHWDKPMSEQPQAVRDALAKLGEKLPDSKLRTGSQAYGLLQSRLRPDGTPNTVTDAAAASSALRELGIPGIRYLDGGSRGSGTGSYNTVLFDDALARILERQ